MLVANCMSDTCGRVSVCGFTHPRHLQLSSLTRDITHLIKCTRLSPLFGRAGFLNPKAKLGALFTLPLCSGEPWTTAKLGAPLHMCACGALHGYLKQEVHPSGMYIIPTGPGALNSPFHTTLTKHWQQELPQAISMHVLSLCVPWTTPHTLAPTQLQTISSGLKDTT